MVRVIIAGSRSFDDYEFMKEKLDEFFSKERDEIEIVSGHADGVDRLGERYAAERGIPCKVFPAEWKKHGKKAGPLRNSQMLEYAEERCPVVVAFWNGTSSGTFDTIKKAVKKDIECMVYLCIPANGYLNVEVCEHGAVSEHWHIDNAFVEAEMEYMRKLAESGESLY